MHRLTHAASFRQEILTAVRGNWPRVRRPRSCGGFIFAPGSAGAWFCPRWATFLATTLLTVSIAAGCGPPLSGRAAKQPATNQVVRPPPVKRLQFVGFSIVPPPGRGWQVVPAAGARLLFGFDAVFIKVLGKDQFVHAYVVAHRTATASSDPKQILDEEIERTITPRGFLAKRSSVRLSGAICLRWELTREGNEPFRGIKDGNLSSEWVSRHRGYLCSHPDAPAFLIEIGYFDTVSKAPPNPAIADEGEHFLHGLTFTSLRMHITQRGAGAKARGLALWDNALWLSEEDSGTVRKIDSTSAGTIAEIRVGAKPEGLTAGFGSVWVPNWGSGTVSRIDPITNRAVAAVQVGRGPADIALGFGSAWVTNERSASVSRLNPSTNRVDATIVTGGRPDAIAAAAGAIWVENFNTIEIWRISPENNRVMSSIKVGHGRHFIAGDTNTIWVTNAADHTVSKVDPATNRVIATISVGGVPAGLALTAKTVWIADFSDGTVVTIAANGESVAPLPIPVGDSPFLLAGNEKTMWVLDVWGWQYGSLSRIDY